MTAPTPAEFMPTGPNDTDLARQQTDAANHVFFNQNMGFQLLEDAFRDGNVGKFAAMQVFWSQKSDIQIHDYTGLSPEQYVFLAQDDTVDVLEFAEVGDTVNAKIRRTVPRGHRSRGRAFPVVPIACRSSADRRKRHFVAGPLAFLLEASSGQETREAGSRWQMHRQARDHQ